MPCIIFGLFPVTRVNVNGKRVDADFVISTSKGALVVRGSYYVAKELGLNVVAQNALHLITARVAISAKGDLILDVCRASTPLADKSCRFPAQMMAIGEVQSSTADGGVVLKAREYVGGANHEMAVVASLSEGERKRFQNVLPLIKSGNTVFITGTVDVVDAGKTQFSLAGLELGLLGGPKATVESVKYEETGDEWWLKLMDQQSSTSDSETVVVLNEGTVVDDSHESKRAGDEALESKRKRK